MLIKNTHTHRTRVVEGRSRGRQQRLAGLLDKPAAATFVAASSSPSKRRNPKRHKTHKNKTKHDDQYGYTSPHT